MSPCQPLDESKISPPPSSSIGLNFAPQLPALNIPFPELPIEDLLGLFDRLSMILPSGTLKPHLSANFSKDALDGILSLLEKFMPFLMLYTFFLPVLNLILCIIEVLCSIANPFKLIRALKRLFRNCIPEFLALFPAFALIIMIISLLLLILTLIEYLIERILRIIALIAENLTTLTDAVTQGDSNSVLSITAKIGDLLCLLQNLFAGFGVILIIVQIIESILKLSFKIPPCDDSDGSDDGCCTPDVCPSFIKNNTTITSTTGTLQYFNEVAIDSGLSLPVGFAPLVSDLRKESWQFSDPDSTQALQFNNITHAFDLPPGVTSIFFPAGTSYGAVTDYKKVPYTLNMTLLYNPTTFGRSDPKGTRLVNIHNCIIVLAPTDGVSNYQNIFVAPFNGTFSLAGGLAFESDNTTPVIVSGDNQANLNDLIHMPAVLGPSPVLSPTDGYSFTNLTYTLSINHEVLFSEDLITLGCIPDLAESKNFINNTIALPLAINSQKLNNIALPDLNVSTQCILNAVNTFKQSISIDSLNVFQADITNCLNNLQNDTQSALCSVMQAGFDQYNSLFTIDPSIQFTTMPIKVSVMLAESTGKNMATNLSAAVASCLEPLITAKITLGEISSFTYDGAGNFVANITSKDQGNGTIEISFDNKIISILNNPANIDLAPSTTPRIINYTFVSSPAIGEEPRRDDGDVARDNG